IPLKPCRNDRAASPQRIHDRLTIDRVGECATHQRIFKLRMELVENGQTMVKDRTALDLESVVLFDALDLVRRNVASKLILTREQTIDAGGYFRHFDETDLLQRRTSAPIF